MEIDEAIEAWLTMEMQHVANLEKDIEFLRLALPNPSSLLDLRVVPEGTSHLKPYNKLSNYCKRASKLGVTQRQRKRATEDGSRGK
ncbi:hypothetical protein JHK82_048060 [Glycine max]|nr:hypothetical protein JHK82_048060 [Glycine max]